MKTDEATPVTLFASSRTGFVRFGFGGEGPFQGPTWSSKTEETAVASYPGGGLTGRKSVNANTPFRGIMTRFDKRRR